MNLTIAVHVRDNASMTLTSVRVDYPLTNFTVTQRDVLIDELLMSDGIVIIGNQGLKRVVSVAAWSGWLSGSLNGRTRITTRRRWPHRLTRSNRHYVAARHPSGHAARLSDQA